MPWLTTHFPGIDFLSHDAGHLLEMMFGWKASPHFGPFHIVSNVFIFGGFIMLYSAWRLLYQAQKEHRVAKTGLYARMRHPQYVGFVLIMFGFLLQWPTLTTLAMFPVLVWVYARLAEAEEREAIAEFGAEYEPRKTFRLLMSILEIRCAFAQARRCRWTVPFWKARAPWTNPCSQVSRFQ